LGRCRRAMRRRRSLAQGRAEEEASVAKHASVCPSPTRTPRGRPPPLSMRRGLGPSEVCVDGRYPGGRRRRLLPQGWVPTVATNGKGSSGPRRTSARTSNPSPSMRRGGRRQRAPPPPPPPSTHQGRPAQHTVGGFRQRAHREMRARRRPLASAWKLPTSILRGERCQARRGETAMDARRMQLPGIVWEAAAGVCGAFPKFSSPPASQWRHFLWRYSRCE
jgi:hypothetical protein